jgi:ATP-dependent Clp protease protease subunit
MLLEGNGMSVDVFSKLLEDRIIFLSTEVDEYVTNIIKAQLLYLESESDDDISIYIVHLVVQFIPDWVYLM